MQGCHPDKTSLTHAQENKEAKRNHATVIFDRQNRQYCTLLEKLVAAESGDAQARPRPFRNWVGVGDKSCCALPSLEVKAVLYYLIDLRGSTLADDTPGTHT